MSPLNLAAQAACGPLPSLPRDACRTDVPPVTPLAQPRASQEAPQALHLVDVVIEDGDGEVAWRGHVLVPDLRYRAFFPVEGGR